MRDAKARKQLRLRLAALAALPAALVGVTTGTSHAADTGNVRIANGEVVYTGTAKANHVSVFRILTTGKLRVLDTSATATEPLSAGSGCTQIMFQLVECDNKITRFKAALGDGADTFISKIPLTAHVAGQGGDDTFTAGASPVSTGVAYSGGAGFDTVDYSPSTRGVTVTMDNVANDGRLGDADNVGRDIERLFGSSHADTLIGNELNNKIAGRNGKDTLRGGAGTDTIDALDNIGPEADAIIDCGSGTDTAFRDLGDDPRATSCEKVSSLP